MQVSIASSSEVAFMRLASGAYPRFPTTQTGRPSLSDHKDDSMRQQGVHRQRLNRSEGPMNGMTRSADR
jgi:hypothetical protein